MKYTLSVLLYIAVSGCIVEDDTHYKAFLKNESDHELIYLFYKNGFLSKDDTILLTAYQSILIGEGVRRGINNRGGFSSKYFSESGEDSGIVMYDGLYSVVHYVFTPTIPALKYIPLTSKRNIFNRDAYNYEFEDINKHTRNQTYIFTFTEADYEFAKQ